MVQKMAENKLLTIADRMLINREVCRFREELSMTEKFSLTEEERSWM